ncbi:MAG: 4-(cytidine 5'-diphospho)-2-C-methyl-D-erythritol kinase [Candidatus Omnitrophica bacterium]|nr:4-(cytidine 5'-diphospho)-2-C-methyl-D-erythritol kinase [Candidatus Omnitrophota bacterium]MDD5488193.1 4-(cytidine 5'-diphospho)-2-C-methyl-D-erythritol kinase [Candidatus Omnitrophota bacterium]
MDITAPAKVNLYLKVVGKREDGYHEIETVFEKISLSDELSVQPTRTRNRITCNDPEVPTGEGLLSRTISEFNSRIDADYKFKVHLNKKIPISAGLGGGSSDAAALLKAVNHLAGNPLNSNELMEIGALLGSDVPFFLQESAFAYAEGRGEVISPMGSSAEINHIIINPPFGISTKSVYSRVSSLSLTKEKGVDKLFTAFLREKNILSIAENLHNDLQAIVLRDFPEISELLTELKRSGAKGELLSGSGSSVFGIFEPELVPEARERLVRIFPEERGWKIFAVNTFDGE